MLRWLLRNTRTRKAQVDADTDAELAARLRQKDDRAFLLLYDRHSRTVCRFLLHMTGSVATAEELTQELFVTVLHAISSGAIDHFDPARGTLEAYLLGIARNLARAELRRSHRLVSLESLLDTPAWDRLLVRLSQQNQEDAGLALVLARAEAAALWRAILDLPVHYREVVVLCSLQQKSYQQAASLLQLAEGTIASRMNRARSLLAAKLGKAQSEKGKTSPR